MGTFVGCFDLVSAMIKKLNSTVYSAREIDRNKLSEIEDICNNLDNASEEFGVRTFTADIDSEKMSIIVGMECQNVTINTNHIFHSVMDKAVEINISYCDDEYMSFSLTFPGVWFKTE